MKVQNFKPFIGQHCETTATGSLLKNIGLDLSESMIFGVGEGLNFIYWDMKIMDFPFVGGRSKGFELTRTFCQNLNLNLIVQETSSLKKAWTNVAEVISQGLPVGLKLDCYHLEYFTKKVHFPAHFVAMYGFDETKVLLVDTERQGGCVETSIKSLELARNERGPMSSKNLSYSIIMPGKIDPLEVIALNAIKSNALAYLNPPIKNIAWKGIEKFSDKITGWFSRSNNNIEYDLTLVALLMEKAGTGGSIFRNIYTDFLKEVQQLVKIPQLKEGEEQFNKSAKMWKRVADLIDEAGRTQKQNCLDEASSIILNISKIERSAMTTLSQINIAS